MPLTIVVGGGYGDTGKEVVHGFLALKDNYHAAVRSQGPQHGGEVWYKGDKSIHDYVPTSEYESDPKKGECHRFREITSAIYNPNTQIFLAVGAIVDPEVVLKEVGIYREFDVDSRLKIDKKATVILQKHKVEDEKLKALIGSVGTGYRSAMCDRIMARGIMVEHIPELSKYAVGETWRILNEMLDDGKSVGILGTQSVHLSTYYAKDYPNCNGYDNTAQTLLGQVGIGANREKNIILVLKSFVSRVGVGNLEGQISEEEAERLGWAERGTVTKRKRRVAPFNYESARDSITLNTPTDLAITKADVLFPEVSGVQKYDDLSERCQRWIEDLEGQLAGPPITLIKTGPGVYDIIDDRKERGTL